MTLAHKSRVTSKEREHAALNLTFGKPMHEQHLSHLTLATPPESISAKEKNAALRAYAMNGAAASIPTQTETKTTTVQAPILKSIPPAPSQS